MEFWLHFLPLIIYILLIVLLVVGIVLAIKTIITMNKVEKIVDDVNEKVASLKPVFNVIDFAADKLSYLTDKAVDAVGNVFSHFLLKKKKRKNEKEEEDYE